jgi:hypothetical protein
MEPLQSYYLRFWKRFRDDATPWARDNIIWGVVVLVVPPLAAYVRNPRTAIDWELIRTTFWLYALTFTAYVLVHLVRVPKKLDRERAFREEAFRHAIAAKDRIISDRDETIRTLREKPKRTSAEQHDYDRAKAALQRFGKKAVIALRHLRTHGALIFGSFNPILPAGLTRDETVWAYNACAGEGLVTRADNTPKYGEATFAISPRMGNVLEELLYDDSISLER